MQKLTFGIVQGRLIQSPHGQLQWFPQERWEEEFALAAQTGIDFVEWIAERQHNPANPIWNDEGIKKIKSAAKENGRLLHAFCNDYVIDHPLKGNQDVVKQNIQLLERGALLGCEKYILPLFEQSELTMENLEEYVPSLRQIADRAASLGIKVCLETNLKGADLIKVLERLNHTSLSVVYDTGNRAAFGHDLAGDIRKLGGHISHVHIKDKNAANENVLLGTGLVNFSQVFQALSDIKYQGPYTFETQRGKDPVKTAAYNIELVKFFHREASS